MDVFLEIYGKLKDTITLPTYDYGECIHDSLAADLKYLCVVIIKSIMFALKLKNIITLPIMIMGNVDITR